MIENGATVGDIIEAVDCRYAGERSQMETAIGKFVEDLRAEELIIKRMDTSPERDRHLTKHLSPR